MLIQSDARAIPLRANSVQCVITSPPYYGLRNYGVPGQIGLEKTHLEYIESIREVSREIWRVLSDNGVFWLNLGDSYASGKGTCHNPGGNTSSYNTHLKEQNVHPLDRGNKSSLSRVGLKPKDLIMVPTRVALALQGDGWYLRSMIPWLKRNGMPSSVEDRPGSTVEYIFMLTKSPRYFYDRAAIRMASIYGVPNSPASIKSPEGQGYSRRAKADKQRGHSRRHQGFNDRWDKMSKEEQCSKGRERRNSDWFFESLLVDQECEPLAMLANPVPYTKAHYATFPPKMVRPLILSCSSSGDVILDPFCGSGTTVMVARDLGRVGIGCDLTYHELSKERIYGPLFAATINA